MATNQPVAISSGVMSYVRWILKREPWRAVYLLGGLPVTALVLAIFLVSEGFLRRGLHTFAFPPATLGDWLFWSGFVLTVAASICVYAAYCLSVRLALITCLLLLMRLVGVFVVSLTVVPFEFVRAWLGSLPPLHLIGSWLAAVGSWLGQPKWPPASTGGWLEDAAVAIICLVTLAMVVYSVRIFPEQDDITLLDALMIPIVLRTAAKVERKGNSARAQLLREEAERYRTLVEAKNGPRTKSPWRHFSLNPLEWWRQIERDTLAEIEESAGVGKVALALLKDGVPLSGDRTKLPKSPACWGDDVGEERQRQLEELLEAWNQEGDYGKRKGPFDGITLTGADVFFLATRALVGTREKLPDQATARTRLLEARDESNKHAELASGAEWRPWYLDLSALHLEGSDLGHAQLEDAQLSGAHLEGATLWPDASLVRANLGEAHLEGVMGDGANLEHAYLMQAHLETLYVNTP